MSHYEEILIEYWRAGEVEQAIKYYNQWKRQGLLSQETIERLDKIFPSEFELFLENPEEHLKVLFDIYRAVKGERKWDDDQVCENLGISKEDIEQIMFFRLVSKGIRDKILQEFIRVVEEIL